MRNRAVRYFLFAACAVGAANVVAPVVVAPPASASLAAPFTGAFLDLEPAIGSADSQQISFDAVTPGSAAGGIVTFALAAPGQSWQVSLAAPPGQPLVPGVYENVQDPATRAAGHPGLSVTGNLGCGWGTGRFIVDQATLDANGVPQVFSARFERHCGGQDPAWFGAVSYNATADYRARTAPGSVAFGSVVGSKGSGILPVTITNNGPSTLTVSHATIGGNDAADFVIASDTCGTTLAAAQSCAFGVRFTPGGVPGDRFAKLTFFDDLSPSGGTGTGRDVILTGTAAPDPYGEYTSLTPARILDTRGDAGVVCNKALTKLGPAAAVDVQVTGCGGIPVTGVGAVVMNVTVTEPTAASYLTVWPKGTARPVLSNLNYVPGQTVPNAVTVKLGTGGEVAVYNNAGSAHVVIDVVGFYADSEGPFGLRFHAINPRRLVDTRTVSYPIKAGVPFNRRMDAYRDDGSGVEDLRAIVLNVTVTQPTASGHLTIYPDDVPKPLASSLNFTPGLTVPNLVIVRVPADHGVIFSNSAGQLHLVIDVVGYYDVDKTTDAGRVLPNHPFRGIDTRTLTPPAPLGPSTVLSVYASPAPSVAAMVANVTVTEPTIAGFLTVYPDRSGGPDWPDFPSYPPPSSNLNFVPGQTVPNLVMTAIGGDGYVNLYNPFGSLHLIIDVFGYFTASRPVLPGAASQGDAGGGFADHRFATVG